MELRDTVPGVAAPSEVARHLGGLVKARAFPSELDLRVVAGVDALSPTIASSSPNAFGANQLVVLFPNEVVPGMW